MFLDRYSGFSTLDFYLWGRMKEIVYSEPIDTVQDLEVRILDAAASIRNDHDQLQRVSDSFLRRARACINANGGHFEQVL